MAECPGPLMVTKEIAVEPLPRPFRWARDRVPASRAFQSPEVDQFVLHQEEVAGDEETTPEEVEPRQLGSLAQAVLCEANKVTDSNEPGDIDWRALGDSICRILVFQREQEDELAWQAARRGLTPEQWAAEAIVGFVRDWIETER